jgi:uncharacterized OB-fold protein
MIENHPLPEVDRETAPFWEHCGRRELAMQTCASCGHKRFPPRPMCPVCQSMDSTWTVMSGRGTVWSYVVAHPPLLPAFMPFAPYPVVVVALDEDPNLRLVGNLLAAPDAEINSVDPSTITIGEPVRAVFRPVGEDVVMPQWVRGS